MFWQNMMTLLGGRAPGQLVVQITNRCNADCRQCGMRRSNRIARRTLPVDEVKRTIDAAAERGINALSFTGGEPFLEWPMLKELIEYAGAAGIPYIRTGTNGFWFRNPDRPDFEERVKTFADALAGSPLRNLWISIDSAETERHERLRGLPGVVEGIRRALPWFHERGLYPTANLGINRMLAREVTPEVLPPLPPDADSARLQHVEEAFYTAFCRFYETVEQLGFTIANACYPMSGSDDTEPVYEATSTDVIVHFSRREKVRLFSALSRAVREHRNRLRIFTPLSALLALVRQHSGDTRHVFACRGGVDFFYVDCRDGHTYPCGYRGDEDLGPFPRMPWPAPNTRHCRQCDWECFRDPAQALEPLTLPLRRPLALARFLADSEAAAALRCDIGYYRACDLFDGRTPPDYRRMGHPRYRQPLPQPTPDRPLEPAVSTGPR